MRDPFPFPAPAFLAKASQPLADYFNLATLPMHIHEVLFAAAFYQFTNVVISPYLSRKLFPKTYPKLNSRTRVNWDIHVVSLVQSCFVNVLALWVMWADEERKSMNWRERVWGYTPALGLVQAFGCGYFLWDLYVSVRYLTMFGPGLLAHAVSALMVFSLGFRPFINFYAPTFILYELSSPFLNIHWFCDKLSLTGSKIQLYNGIMLLFSFFSCRLVWGMWQSYVVFGDIFRAINAGSPYPSNTDPLSLDDKCTQTSCNAAIMAYATDPIPLWLGISYLGANITLNGLNVNWFSKMIATVRKRFPPPIGTLREEVPVPAKVAKSEKEHPLVEGIDVETDSEVDEDSSIITNDTPSSAIATGHDSGKLLAEDTQIARGLYNDGRRTIEVEKKEVRSRRRG